MSNLLLLLQTTQPEKVLAEGMWLAVFAALSALSASVVVRRRLYAVPPIPQDAQTPTAPVLAAVLGVAVFTYLGVTQVCALAMGVTPEIAKTSEGMRKMLLCTPAAQFITAGIIIALLGMHMPRILQWTDERGGYIKKAISGYLLALPWVFLVGMLVSLLAGHLDPSAKKQHPIFEMWQVEGSGTLLFRMAAMFSAIIAAPVGEELVFRGVLQRLVHRLSGNPLLSVVAASVAFAAIHSPWTTQPSVFVLSLFLGWAYFRSGSILVPMLMHATFNLMQFVFFIYVVLPSGSSPAR